MKIGKAELKRRLSALKGREFRVSGDTDEKTDDEILSAGLDATKGGIFGGFDSENFILEQGVVLAHVKHKGSGEFSISFLSSKIWQKDYNHDKWITRVNWTITPSSEFATKTRHRTCGPGSTG